MPIPSPSTLDRLLHRFAGPAPLGVSVWAIEDDAGPGGAPPSLEREIFSAPPHLVCLGADEDGLVLVRQTRDTLDDLDGERVPWPRVRGFDRDPHIGRDLLTIDVEGRSPMRVAVTSHLLLPSNRTAAKSLTDLARRHFGAPR